MYYTAQQGNCVLVKTLNSRTLKKALRDASAVLNDLLESTVIEVDGMCWDKIVEILATYNITIISHNDPLIMLRVSDY
jgi:hypothetical protein